MKVQHDVSAYLPSFTAFYREILLRLRIRVEEAEPNEFPLERGNRSNQFSEIDIKPRRKKNSLIYAKEKKRKIDITIRTMRTRTYHRTFDGIFGRIFTTVR